MTPRFRRASVTVPVCSLMLPDDVAAMSLMNEGISNNTRPDGNGPLIASDTALPWDEILRLSLLPPVVGKLVTEIDARIAHPLGGDASAHDQRAVRTLRHE